MSARQIVGHLPRRVTGRPNPVAVRIRAYVLAGRIRGYTGRRPA